MHDTIDDMSDIHQRLGDTRAFGLHRDLPQPLRNNPARTASQEIGNDTDIMLVRGVFSDTSSTIDTGTPHFINNIRDSRLRSMQRAPLLRAKHSVYTFYPTKWHATS